MSDLLRPEWIEDELLCAGQNARVARNAEQYYREMYRGDVSSWNMRDRYMTDTLDELLAFLARRAQPKVPKELA